ncbi:MAG: hypothetical protein MJ059_01095 [Lachnospiraceae bacterium]|nr:hypothetical protein [Lachnospiraceae bacterium]
MRKQEYKMKLPLFDDYWIDFRRDTIRRWFKPELYSVAPAGPYASMFYDDTVGKYRIYYENVREWAVDGVRDLFLAESDDLKTFTDVEINGTKALSISKSGLHGCTVLYDKFETDPKKRYKLTGMLDMGEKEANGENDWIGVEIAFSEDGINFEQHKELVANPQTSDALNKLFYNPIDEEYTLLHRSAFVDRRISVRTSKDLKNWSEPHIILNPAAGYNSEGIGMQHYSMTANYYDGIFYGLLWQYNTCLYNEDYSRMFGFMQPELTYSYDGHEFLYTTHEPLMDRPVAPAPGCLGLAPDDMCLSKDGKEYYILCFGYSAVHGTQESNARLNEKLEKAGVKRGNPIYKIRKDGFCGIESVGMGGQIVTKGICLLDDDLTFNVQANVGSARFGIMSIDGNYIEGFELDNCIPFEFDDSVSYKPQWKGHSLNEVLNRQVRIVVELNSAILHCIEGTAQPFVRQRQRSFSHPEGIPVEERRKEVWRVI